MTCAARRATAIIACLLVVLSSCGLRLDDSPNVISAEQLPEELRPGQLPTPTALPASESGPGRDQVFMIQDNRLVGVERQIVDTPEQLMQILLFGTFPEEVALGIESAIYRGTEVQAIEVNPLFDVAVVDLAPGSLDPRNSEQRLAFAQIVYTLTSLPEIEAVQFIQTDPEDPESGPVDIAVQTDAGTTLPGDRVTRDDFALLQPSISVARPAFDIPLATPTAVVDPNAPPRFDLAVYMLDADDHVVKVERFVESSPDALLVAVIEGPRLEEREDDGIRSAIPPDALANPIEIGRYDVIRSDSFGFQTLENLNVAIVDFESGSLPSPADGDERFLAVAQIVLTLTQLAGIDQVAISVDGTFIPMPTDGGGVTLPFEPNITRGVDRSDYQTALAVPDDEAENAPGEAQQAPSSAEPATTAVPTPSAEAPPTAEPTPSAETAPSAEPTPSTETTPNAATVPNPTPQPTTTPVPSATPGA